MPLLTFESMSFLGKNLRILRKQQSLTQGQLAEKLGLNRSVIGAYEEGRAEPRLQTLIAIAEFFNISLDDLVIRSLDDTPASAEFNSEIPLKVLSIAVDKSSEEELITVVPVKAAAGYLDGYGDLDFIEGLPQFSMPVKEIPQDLSLRMFQVEGESMHPLPEGSYVLSSYENDIRNAGGGHPYIVVTKNDGIVFKRVENLIGSNGTFRLISENPEYAPYEVAADEILEMWRARAFMMFDFPVTPLSKVDSLRIREITDRLSRIESKLSED